MNVTTKDVAMLKPFVWKDGRRYRMEGEVQRYLCLLRGYRFSDAKVKVNVFKQKGILSDSVHNFGDGDFVNVGVGKVGFKNSSFTIGKDVGSHDFSNVGKTINDFLRNSRERRWTELGTFFYIEQEHLLNALVKEWLERLEESLNPQVKRRFKLFRKYDLLFREIIRF